LDSRIYSIFRKITFLFLESWRPAEISQYPRHGHKSPEIWFLSRFSKITVLVDSTVDLEFVGFVDCEATDSYMQFRRLLENISIVDWPFLFWDNVNHCTINSKLELVNKVRIDVFVIANEESGGLGCKHR
jgi:hypothetical protein